MVNLFGLSKNYQGIHLATKISFESLFERRKEFRAFFRRHHAENQLSTLIKDFLVAFCILNENLELPFSLFLSIPNDIQLFFHQRDGPFAFMRNLNL